MKKKVLTWLSVAVIAMVCVGCGSKAGNDIESEIPEMTVESTAASEPEAISETEEDAVAKTTVALTAASEPEAISETEEDAVAKTTVALTAASEPEAIPETEKDTAAKTTVEPEAIPETEEDAAAKTTTVALTAASEPDAAPEVHADTSAAETAEIEVEAMDIVMYAQGSVNVRSLPGTDGNKLGKLSVNQEIRVTGKCVEGNWYQVEYKDAVAYVSSKYLGESMVVVSNTSASADASQSAAPAVETQSAAPAAEAQTQVVTQPAGSQSVHPNMWDHEWKKHVTTGYHNENVFVGYLFTCGNCEFETMDRDAIHQHIMEHATVGTLSDGLDVIMSGNYGEIPIYENQQVYGEYVDYDYCDCGATTPVGVRYSPEGVDARDWWATHDWYAAED
ncbi:MAG: SH3 domain-containing protein [Butyrivibrio sp.]|nr:SH3 domain-containing protein [Acetatifactor muris]MCM1558748.1 SH3 domain-containing protein [Butyrivibrio sp.]